jgi:UPF0176 protein
MSYTVAALYKFVRLVDLEEKAESLQVFCKDADIRGTLLLAAEGINGTISGDGESVSRLICFLESWPEIDELDVKYSSSAGHSFSRLKVKVKDEIVTMGKSGIDPNEDAGTYVEPRDWNDLISRDDVLLIDTRNAYEFKIGRFENAIEPGTDNFRQFPDWADELVDGESQPAAIAMYCTGGIRCEKASSYMRQLGFDEIYHLKGGILKYLEEVSQEDSLWEGECFVFDSRVSVSHGVVSGNFEICYGCQMPVSVTDKESSLYEAGVACPHCSEDALESDKERYRERQRQITLARERGEEHFGDYANEKKAQKRKSKGAGGYQKNTSN